MDYPMIGREEEDHEARCALSTLFEAEEIKLKGKKFLDRIEDELEKRQGILQRIRDSLSFMEDGEDDDDEGDMEDAPTDMESFLKRLNSARRKQVMMQNESPEERRYRIKKKGEPIVRGVVVKQFT
jgi:hypothetical protein